MRAYPKRCQMLDCTRSEHVVAVVATQNLSPKCFACESSEICNEIHQMELKLNFCSTYFKLLRIWFVCITSSRFNGTTCLHRQTNCGQKPFFCISFSVSSTRHLILSNCFAWVCGAGRILLHLWQKKNQQKHIPVLFVSVFLPISCNFPFRKHRNAQTWHGKTWQKAATRNENMELIFAMQTKVALITCH